MNSSLLALFLFFFFVSSSSSARKFLFIRVPRFRLPSCCLLIDGLIFFVLPLSVVSFLGFKTLIHPINSCASASLPARASVVCSSSYYFFFCFFFLVCFAAASVGSDSQYHPNPRQIVSPQLITNANIRVPSPIAVVAARSWRCSRRPSISS